MKKKVLVIALMMALIILVVGFAGCAKVKEYAKKAEDEIDKYIDVSAVTDDQGNELSPGVVYEMPSGLVFKDCASTSESASGAASVSITATVYPVTASNKAVDWLVSWATPESVFASGKQVTDYVTVVPTYDGSPIAVVTCHLPFESEVIRITCVTRERGYTASCNVTFLGNPDRLSIITGIDLTESETEHHVARYVLSSNSQYDMDLVLTNDWGVIGATFGVYEVTVTGIGTLTVCDWFENAEGGHWYGEERNISIDTIKDAIIEASIVNGKLHITTHKAVTGYYSHVTGGTSSFIKHDLFKAYKLMHQYDAIAFFKVRVTETQSGKSAEINIDVGHTVTGLGLDWSSIEF